MERLLRSCLTGKSRHREVVCLCDTREEGQRSCVLNANKPMQVVLLRRLSPQRGDFELALVYAEAVDL